MEDAHPGAVLLQACICGLDFALSRTSMGRDYGASTGYLRLWSRRLTIAGAEREEE